MDQVQYRLRAPGGLDSANAAGMKASASSVWFLVGNGGMHHGDDYWGLYRGYYIGIPSPIPY